MISCTAILHLAIILTICPDGKEDHLVSRFTGWMFLNYNKPVQVSSSLTGYPSNNAVDENIKSYWSASSGNAGEWISTDLGDDFRLLKPYR